MEKLLIVSATQFEIEPLLKALNAAFPLKQGVINGFKHKKLQVDVLITGVGMVNTAFAMGGLKDKTYDLAINAGVCGVFNDDIKIGDVVHVAVDCFSEMGAENGDEFLTLSQLNLGNEIIVNPSNFGGAMLSKVKKVTGITVNTVHGNDKSIEQIKTRFNVDVESMEGAAFLMICNSLKWHAMQIRAVSNKVERRNKENWNMPLAIENLNKILLELLDNLK